MESNEQTGLTRKMEKDTQRGEQMTASWGEKGGVEGLSKKEKGLLSMDNRLVIAGGRRLQGD